MSIKKPYSLDAARRLKSRKSIAAVFDQGKFIHQFPLRLGFTLASQENRFPKAAFSVSARKFPRAVDRNRIKRLLREVYRQKAPELAARLQEKHLTADFFLLFTGSSLPQLAELEAAVSAISEKFFKLIDG